MYKMSPRGVLRKWGTTHRGVHLHSWSELRRLGERRYSKEHQREHQLLCDLEDGQLEGTRLTHNKLSGVLRKEEILEAYNYVMNKDPNNRHNFLFVDLTPKKHHPSPYRMNYTEWIIHS